MLPKKLTRLFLLFSISLGIVFMDLHAQNTDPVKKPVQKILKKETNPAKEQPFSIQLEKKPVTETLHKDQDEKDSIRLKDATSLETATWTTIMSETFEGLFPPNEFWDIFDEDGSYNGEYYWDDDDYRPYQGYWSAWCANGGADWLDPEFNFYPKNCKSWMIYGPFSLEDACDAELLFYYWNISEPDSDFFFWGASTNGFNFYGSEFSGNSSGWKRDTIDFKNVYILGNLCGQEKVWIAFNFESNNNIVTNYGTFIDNIILQKVIAKPDLIITSMTPSKSYPEAGEDITVTVAVKNQGNTSTSGISTIGLYYDLSAPPNTTTWEDKIDVIFWLDPDSTETIVFTGVTSTTATTWNMYSLADCDSNVAESNETNNYKGPVTITWRQPPPKPDLVFYSISESPDYPGVANYDYLYTTVTVQNTGDTASGAFYTDIFYDTNATPVPIAFGDDYRYTYSPFTVWSTNTFTFVTRDSSGNNNTWQNYLLVDSYKRIDEKNENNNTNGPRTISWVAKPQYPTRTRDEIINTAMEFVNLWWTPDSANCDWPVFECYDWSCDSTFLDNLGYSIQGEAY